MQSIKKYDLYIFDCDGVILDSNKLKIEAMRVVLDKSFPEDDRIKECIKYFSRNFGKSRFHHVDMFLSNILNVEAESYKSIRIALLDAFSEQCKLLYINSELTDGFIDMFEALEGVKYVASGSEECELREVFEYKGLKPLFKEVYGSPVHKSDLVRNILNIEGSNNAVMIGDAVSDLEAAQSNHIDFVAYLPYSNVMEELKEAAYSKGHKFIYNWSEL